MGNNTNTNSAKPASAKPASATATAKPTAPAPAPTAPTATKPAPTGKRSPADSIGPRAAAVLRDFITRTPGDTLPVSAIISFAGPASATDPLAFKPTREFIDGDYDPRLTTGHAITSTIGGDGRTGLGRSLYALRSAGIVVGGSAIPLIDDRRDTEIRPDHTVTVSRSAALAFFAATPETYYIKLDKRIAHNKSGRFATPPSTPIPLPTT